MSADQQNALAQQIAQEIFKKFDADNSGTIDKEEAKEIFMDQLKKSGSTLLKFDEAQFEEFFSKADANKDGEISFEEAQEFVKKFMLKQ